MKLCFPLVLIGLLGSAQNSLKWGARVRVDVDPSDIDSELISHLARQLRALGDISIVEDKPDYIIKVVSITNKTESGKIASYTAFYGVYTPVPIDALEILAMRDKSMTGLIPLFKGAEFEIRHYIQTIPPKSVDEACKEVVAHVDSEVFQPVRLVFEKTFNQPK
jgi:hypothetical protein